MKKECIAMLLAGGQGSRLYVLTGAMAKPAVPFGGKFRIIDFPLSNCTNSGIDTVGVLTQYRPMELNSYIGSGQPWTVKRAWRPRPGRGRKCPRCITQRSANSCSRRIFLAKKPDRASGTWVPGPN